MSAIPARGSAHTLNIYSGRLQYGVGFSKV